MSCFSNSGELFVCRKVCYKGLTKFQRASEKVKEIRREIEEVSDKRELPRAKRLIRADEVPNIPAIWQRQRYRLHFFSCSHQQSGFFFMEKGTYLPSLLPFSNSKSPGPQFRVQCISISKYVKSPKCVTSISSAININFKLYTETKSSSSNGSISQ